MALKIVIDICGKTKNGRDKRDETEMRTTNNKCRFEQKRDQAESRRVFLKNTLHKN